MRNVIIGTAGHVDHGKTCLIRALTGMDTDRLAEEKKRGITIDLGFASLDGGDDINIGIIDVPGHEKFIRNMLAGIGGIDLVLLIIALDEGVMPQTREHFEILKMLGIRQGIIVFTKMDLADEEMTGIVREETEELVRGSFLEGAPQVCVSAYTGENIEELRTLILKMVRGTGSRRTDPELFRLPVDRVFTVKGFGTVVTGTLTEGSCAAGDELMLYPQEKRVRVRGIQNHNRAEERAEAGQRTALNLAGVEKDETERGAVLARPDSLIPSYMADARVRLFDGTGRRLKNNSRVHISFGSSRAVCKAVLLEGDGIGPGEEAYVQLRFEEPVVMRKGDRFILLFYSPVETFAGGVILEAAAVKHRRNQKKVIEGLKIREEGSSAACAEQEVREFSAGIPGLRELAIRLNETEEQTGRLLEQLREKKKIIAIGDTGWVHQEYWKVIARWAEKTLKDFHSRNIVMTAMEQAEFLERLGREFHLEARVQNLLARELKKRKIIQITESGVALYGRDEDPDAGLRELQRQILLAYREAGIAIPSNKELLSRFAERKTARQVMTDLNRKGYLVKVDADHYIDEKSWHYLLQVLQKKLSEDGCITLAEYRDLLKTSRKYSQMYLEAFDARKYTKLEADVHYPLRPIPGRSPAQSPSEYASGGCQGCTGEDCQQS